MKIPRKYQLECWSAIQSAVKRGVRRMLCVSWPGTGKDQRVDQRVLTPAGWQEIGSLRIGDYVIGADGKPTEVIGVFPQGRKLLYRVTFSDETSTVTGPDHLWQMRTKYDKSRGQWRIVPTRNLRTGKQLLMVRVVEPIEYAEHYQPLPIDPYALGILLGDGMLGNGNNTNVCVSTPEPEILIELRQRVPGVSIKHSGHYDYRLNNIANLKVALHCLGLWAKHSWEKFIPECYLRASAVDRLSILQGLMDTDGSISEVSGEFCTSSQQLANDVMELVRSLGGVTRMRQRQPWFTYKGERKLGRPGYRVYVRLADGMNPFRLPRKAIGYHPVVQEERRKTVVSVEPEGEGESVCIMVDSPYHLYVTEGYTLTHNTHMGAQLRDKLGIERMLILGSGQEILQQWKNEIEEVDPDATVAIEQGDVRDATADHDIVIGSIPTLCKPWRRHKLHRPYDLVQVDECDLSLAPTWIQTLKGFGVGEPGGPLLCGWTGTPHRHDGKLLADLFDEVVYPPSDYKPGPQKYIDDGFLCPARAIRVQSQTDISAVPVFGNDFSQEQLLRAVDVPDRNDLIVTAVEQHAQDRNSILVFVTGVEQARRVAEMLRDRGHKAESMDGKTGDYDRPGIFRRFGETGETRILVNVAVLGRGTNIPRIDCVIEGHPTKSATRYIQGMSRGFRLSPETSKQDLLVIDLVDVCGKHAPMSAAAVFGCRSVDALGQDLRRVQKVCEKAESIGVEVQDGETVDQIERKIIQAERVARRAIKIETTAEAIDLFAATRLATAVEEGSEFPWIRIADEYHLKIDRDHRAALKRDAFGVWGVSVRFGRPLGGENLREGDIPPFREADRVVKRLVGHFTTADGYKVPRWKGASKKSKRWSAPVSKFRREALARAGIRILPPGLTDGAAQVMLDAMELRSATRF